MKGMKTFSIHPLSALIMIIVSLNAMAVAQNVEFNTDVMDLKERSTVDLSLFSQQGYIMPGKYSMTVRINRNELPEQDVTFIKPHDKKTGSIPCIDSSIVDKIGLKENLLSHLKYWNQNKCLELSSLKGMEAYGDLSSGTLNMNIPQAYLEYTADNWDPPARWDQGIAGAIFDYSLNAQNVKSHQRGASQSVSGNGTTGFNIDAWRFRANWQGSYNHTTGVANSTRQNWDWNRYYAYRAISSLRSKLTIGENYLNSDIFDSFRYIGASLVSDDTMLPPNLRGYAPEVTGVAKTNAKVTISQKGRVVYETNVAAGPFRIQDLNTATSGELDVKITEQDGSTRSFMVNTANIPYLTRPGLVRYKFALGKPTDYRRHSQGSAFSENEFSWGVNNGWSLYGGSVLGGSNYNSLAAGIGRDLLAFGALSFDITTSRANLPHYGKKIGNSYRLNYSKHFDKYDSQVTFAGYRFTERNFMSMSQYMDARYRNGIYNSARELYTVTLNKQFIDQNLSANLNYSHQTYWDRPANDNYELTVSSYFDVGRFKNISLSISGFRNIYNDTKDDGLYLGLSLPWGTHGTINYDSQIQKGSTQNTVGYSDMIDMNNNYSVRAGIEQDKKTSFSGYFIHSGDLAQITSNASYTSGQYNSIGMSFQGGMTVTKYGAALHRVTNNGATRMMVDSDGISGVPVRGYGAVSDTNAFGKAVVMDLNNYYRNTVSIDLDHLADDVEANKSVIQSTLTEGAIGYHKFGVVSGAKGMAIIKLRDGRSPPFGAVITNASGNQTGILNDSGSVWLSGIKAGEKMNVSWDGKVKCELNLPNVPPTQDKSFLLPCN